MTILPRGDFNVGSDDNDVDADDEFILETELDLSVEQSDAESVASTVATDAPPEKSTLAQTAARPAKRASSVPVDAANTLTKEKRMHDRPNLTKESSNGNWRLSWKWGQLISPCRDLRQPPRKPMVRTMPQKSRNSHISWGQANCVKDVVV